LSLVRVKRDDANRYFSEIVEQVDVECDMDYTALSVVQIADCPGWFEKKERTELADELLKSSIAALYVVGATEAQRDDVLPTLREKVKTLTVPFGAQRQRPVALVVTKCDLLDEEEVEELKEFFAPVLEDGTVCQIFFTGTDRNNSGIQQLQKYLLGSGTQDFIKEKLSFLQQLYKMIEVHLTQALKIHRRSLLDARRAHSVHSIIQAKEYLAEKLNEFQENWKLDWERVSYRDLLHNIKMTENPKDIQNSVESFLSHSQDQKRLLLELALFRLKETESRLDKALESRLQLDLDTPFLKIHWDVVLDEEKKDERHRHDGQAEQSVVPVNEEKVSFWKILVGGGVAGLAVVAAAPMELPLLALAATASVLGGAAGIGIDKQKQENQQIIDNLHLRLAEEQKQAFGLLDDQVEKSSQVLKGKLEMVGANFVLDLESLLDKDLGSLLNHLFRKEHHP
jgi:hypothetical protein